jgi:hypothetical protein
MRKAFKKARVYSGLQTLKGIFEVSSIALVDFLTHFQSLKGIGRTKALQA